MTHGHGFGAGLNTNSQGGGGAGGVFDALAWDAILDPGFGTTPIRAVGQIGDRVYFGGDAGKLTYTTDGISFTLQDLSFGAQPIYAICGTGNFGVVAGGGALLKYTTNGGLTWSGFIALNMGAAYHVYSAATDGTNIVVGATIGKGAYSTNGGVSFAATAFGLGSRDVKGGCTAGGKWVFSATVGQVTRSSNVTSWTAVAHDSWHYLAVAHDDVSGRWLHTSSDGKAYRSDNDGASWTATQNTQFGGVSINAADAAAGVFVIAGDGGKANRSIDGDAWGATLVDVKFGTTDIYGVAVTSLGWFAVGNTGKASISTSKS